MILQINGSEDLVALHAVRDHFSVPLYSFNVARLCMEAGKRLLSKYYFMKSASLK